MPLTLKIILLCLMICLVAFYVKYTILPLHKNKTKKKNKYHDPRNNYFRNNPEHVDMTKDYIENMWDSNK